MKDNNNSETKIYINKNKVVNQLRIDFSDDTHLCADIGSGSKKEIAHAMYRAASIIMENERNGGSWDV